MTDLSIETLALNRQSLLTRHAHTQRLYDTKRHDVALAKGRQAWQPEVRALLEHLQHKEHERSVGAFERLLSAFLQDVLPGPRWVSMDLYTSAGQPSLDFYITKSDAPDAPLEDALNATGGSVTNVLSAGLRLIALIRSGRRRFLVLDEADCWLKPEYVPRFAAVVQQMAVDLGVQVLMISHHDEQSFEAIPHRLQLNRVEGGLSAEWSVLGEIPVWNDDQEGIRSIYLENFLSHASTFIPLSPGVTLINGDNDIGKSAIVSALRAIFYGGKTNVNDSLIRHTENVAKVTIDLGQQRALFWERRLKGKPKEMFMMTDATHGMDRPLHRSESAKDFPSWVKEETGMGLIDGLDVQLGHQQDPVFLLNKSASQRASALAIGSESGYVQAMIALDKEDVSQAKSIERQGERDLELWHRVLTTLEPVQTSNASFQELQKNHQRIQESRVRGQRLALLAERWTRDAHKARTLKQLLHVDAPRAPMLGNTSAARNLANAWQQAHVRQQALNLLSGRRLPTLPQAPRGESAQRLAQVWRLAHQQHEVLQTILRQAAPQLPTAPATSEARRLMEQWRKAAAQHDVLKTFAESEGMLAPTLDARHAERQALLDGWANAVQAHAQALADLPLIEQALADHQHTLHNEFPVCPVCERPWDADVAMTSHAEHESMGTVSAVENEAMNETPSTAKTVPTAPAIEAVTTPASTLSVARRPFKRREV